jgi:dTDP-4-amino-4,6-dideoxy-D-galactose acyltransferase
VGKTIVSGGWEESSFLKEASAFQLVYIFSEKEIRFGSEAIKLVDTKLTFEKELIASLENQGSIPQYQGPWNERLLDLALESGQFSRFKLDARLAQGEFQKLYKLWVLKAWENQNLLVSEDFSGFVSYSTNANFAQIGLIAVDATHQRKGIGKLLVQSAEEKARSEGAELMQIATQAANMPACQLYKKLGYEVVEKSYVYHFLEPRTKKRVSSR